QYLAFFEGQVLGHISDHFNHARFGGQGGGLLAVINGPDGFSPVNAAAVRGFQASDQVEKGAFASAIAANHADAVAGVKDMATVFDNTLLAEGLLQVFQLQGFAPQPSHLQLDLQLAAAVRG